MDWRNATLSLHKSILGTQYLLNLIVSLSEGPSGFFRPANEPTTYGQVNPENLDTLRYRSPFETKKKTDFKGLFFTFQKESNAKPTLRALPSFILEPSSV